MNEVLHGNCLELMSSIPDKSVDLLLTDPPYGVTACRWDNIVSFDLLWREFQRVTKDNAPILIFSSQPFTTQLISSNIDKFRYCWVWDKKFAGNFVQAKRMPLRVTEDVCVFSFGNSSPKYFPQMVKREVPIKKGGNKQSKAIPIAQTENAKLFGESEKVYDEKYKKLSLFVVVS